MCNARVERINAPLLVIGLGGTGSDALSTIKSTFARHFKLSVDAQGRVRPAPRLVRYLVSGDASETDPIRNWALLPDPVSP